MDYKSENKYKVIFNGGTFIESSGSRDGIKKGSIDEEFKWTAFHIQQEVRLAGKKLEDIWSVEYNLRYTDADKEIHKLANQQEK